MIKSVFTNSKKKKLTRPRSVNRIQSITKSNQKKVMGRNSKTRKSANRSSQSLVSRPILINHYVDNLNTIVGKVSTEKIIGFMKKMLVQNNMLTGLLMMIQTIPVSNSKTKEEMEIMGYRDTLYKNVMKMKKYIAYQMTIQSTIASLHGYMSTLAKVLVNSMNKVQSGGVNVLQLILKIMTTSIFISAVLNAESQLVISQNKEVKKQHGAYENYETMDKLNEIVVHGHRFVNTEENTMPHLHQLCNINSDPTCMETITRGYSLTRDYKQYVPELSTPVSQFEEFGTIGRWRGHHMKLVSGLMKQFNSYSAELSDMLYEGCLKIVNSIQGQPTEIVVWTLQETYDDLQKASEKIAQRNIDTFNLNFKKQKIKEEQEEKLKKEEEKLKKEDERRLKEIREATHRLQLASFAAQEREQNQKQPQSQGWLSSLSSLTPSVFGTSSPVKELPATVQPRFKNENKVKIHPRRLAKFQQGLSSLNSSALVLTKVEKEAEKVVETFEEQISKTQMTEIVHSLAQIGLFEKESIPMNVNNFVDVYQIARKSYKKTAKTEIKQSTKIYFNNLCRTTFVKPIRAFYNESTEHIQLDMDTNWYMLRVVMANLMNTIEEKHSKFLDLPIDNIKLSNELRIKSVYELSKLYVKILTDFEHNLIQVYNKIPKNSVNELYSETTDIFATTNAMIKHQIVSENASLFPYTVKNKIQMDMLKSMQKEIWSEQWKEFLTATQETVNNTIAISSAILSPAKEWTKIGIEGVSDVGQTAIKSIIMKPFRVVVDETYAIMITALSAVSVLGVAFLMIICMCYYQFVGKMVFGSIKNKRPESSVPPPPSQSQAPLQPQEQQPTPQPPPPPPPEPEPPQETVQPPQPLPTPSPGTNPEYSQQQYNDYLKQVQEYNQYLEQLETYNKQVQEYNQYLQQVEAYNQYLQQVEAYNQYLQQQQQQQQQQYLYQQNMYQPNMYEQNMYQPNMYQPNMYQPNMYQPYMEEEEENPRQLTGKQIRRSRRGDLRRQRRNSIQND